jgi:sporulation protein YlmC with PRC-barrel domain
VAPISGQTQSTTTSSTSYVQTSKLVGTKVKSSQGEEIGVIRDVVLDRNTGCMAYTVLSAGGTGTRTTGGAKTVAVPWAVYSPTSDLSVLTVTVDRERIYNAPVFDYARIDEYSRPDYINNVYGYYGVSPGAGIGVGVSTGTTTTTSAVGTAATTAGQGASPAAALSPAASASPAATGSPAGTASPAGRTSPTPHATAAASPRATASPHGQTTASPSTTGSRGQRGRKSAAPSPDGGPETGSPPETRESPSAADSPSERTKASRHHEKQGGTPPERPEEQE